MTANDLDLLRQFTREHSQDAFTALVQRHVNLVYSAAFRQVRSSQLAEEIAQSVFADLARDAGRLKPGTILTAWLYQVARRTAIDVIRKESRRQLREQIATEMNVMNAQNELPHFAKCGNDSAWPDIEPLLDEAMSALDDTGRSAILLRYFENKKLREVGEALGTSDDAAQKRVSRAVEQLREFFAKRGVTVGTSGLAVVISANAVQAAPAGLAATISAAAVLAGTAVHTSTVIAATKTIAMTTLQKTLVTATVAVLAGAGIYEARQAAQLREQNQTLQQQQAPLAEEIEQLQRERDAATNSLAGVVERSTKNDTDIMELLKLRGQVGVLHQLTDDANHKAEIAEQKLSEALSYQVQFTKRENSAENNMKMLNLAFRIHASDNDGTFTNDILQLTNELGSTFAKIEKDFDDFDFVNSSPIKLDPKNGTILGSPNIVQLRERRSRQAPNGTWRRIYVFADGSVVTATSIDGNFETWEKANTYLPPADQNQ